MSLPLRLEKTLLAAPVTVATSTTVVTFADRPSVQDWLRLHGEIFLHGRDIWTESRFRRELLERDWFLPQRMWWAISPESDTAIGAITLEVAGDVGQIHWLMVDPAARRRGVAAALLATLENAAWQCGASRITAETLSTWEPAVAFYRRQGYEAA